MGIHSTKSEALHSTADATHHLFEDWFDPIEKGVRERVRGFIEDARSRSLPRWLSTKSTTRARLRSGMLPNELRSYRSAWLDRRDTRISESNSAQLSRRSAVGAIDASCPWIDVAARTRRGYPVAHGVRSWSCSRSRSYRHWQTEVASANGMYS
jgi:hypothetical protein